MSRFREPSFVVLLIVAVAIIMALIWAFTPKAVGRDGLHAVFLDNGQAYFGTITHDDRKTLVLEKVYYIRESQATSTQDIALTKLGTEAHGPEDRMEITREHVLFIERLRDDGRVAEAIRAYERR